ncbi:hypothetical protein BAUCODRAFT_73965 [Baudoinia panamericana UAMH 10762]|uniref:GPI transamidase subunit PIG-U n=1 Tax=Baudoinia panamericana (strain UAMH 10762) TaxID=717646 RepID=M2N7V9_BAUPA|nr:uncharacterized protein BAUCODRAFT_73965 [Baudoinia panamericana UAMH 10762]EMC94890.1 hypothetical protein BAUCODRAFT_73965 [Baudoinia panamericana UAMH 10762]
MQSLPQVYNDHHKAILYGSAAAVRILAAVAFPGLPDTLSLRAELATPVNSFKRLQEGLFLYQRGLDPYNGGIFHQAPLLLPLFSLLPSPAFASGTLLSVLLYTGLDLLVAECLYYIAQSGAAYISRRYRSPRHDRTWTPASVAAIYLFNPYTLLTCLARPTSVFATFFTLLSVSHACQARTATAAFALAIASYISLHPALLLPPVGLLCYDRLCLLQHQGRDATSNGAAIEKPTSTKIAHDQRLQARPLELTLRFSGIYLATFLLLLTLSRLLLPSWSFMPSVYLTPLTLPDLTPNSGLWWYFFTEMFDAFRSFFLGVFWLHMLSYSVPFCLRLNRQPLAAVVLIMGVLAIFEPYANAGDAGVWLSCLCLLSHLFELSSSHRYTFPALATLLYATLLGPAFHHLWIYAGSGNANFFYAITLVWSLALLVLLADTLYAALRDEYEAEVPEAKGREIRQV